MKKETKAQFLLRILNDVPEEKWITRRYTDEKSKCCSMGHIYRLGSENPKDFSFNNCINSQNFTNKEFLKHFKKPSQIELYITQFSEKKNPILDISLIDINDGHDFLIQNKKTNKTYNKVGPKKRIILFLEWMVDEGW